MMVKGYVRHKIVYNDESKHKFRYFQFNPPKIGSTKKYHFYSIYVNLIWSPYFNGIDIWKE